MAGGCISTILNGIAKDCDTISASVGVDKDLILVNYNDLDLAATMLTSNREIADTNKNIGGLTAIKLKTGAVQHIFEGTDYSVIPSITPEVKEDGDTWYSHSIAFTVYSKTAMARKTLEALGKCRVAAITKDRSTGLYELFGAVQGLKISALERVYVGQQNSNFYTVTISTPEIGVMKEPSLGELAVSIVTGP